jgi:hypothetical protein
MVTVKREQIQQVVDEFTCVLCLCNRVDIWVAPCNHACLCEPCARQNLPESTFLTFGSSAAPIVEGDHVNRNINIKQEAPDALQGGGDKEDGRQNVSSSRSGGGDVPAAAIRRSSRNALDSGELEPPEFEVRERVPSSAFGAHTEPADLALRCPICRTDIQTAHKIFL